MPTPNEPDTEHAPDPDATNEVPRLSAAHFAAAALAGDADIAAGAADGDGAPAPGDGSAARAELDSLRVALRIERVRNAELLRALEASRAAARDVRGRAATPDPELERYRADARALAATLTGCEAALAQASASIAAMERARVELTAERDAARRRVTELESARAAGNAGRDALVREARLARELAAAEARAAVYFERLQSGQWRRDVWETQWRALDARAPAAGRRGPAPAATPSAAREGAADARIRDLEAALSAVGSSAAGEARALRLELTSTALARNAARAEAQRLEQQLTEERARLEAVLPEQQALTLELERIRGALAERELHMRRLERNLSQAGQGVARPAPTPMPSAPEGERAPIAPSQTPVAVQAALIPLEGETATAHWIDGRLRIGRASDNDLCLPISSISRHHALIVWVAGGAIIEDLHSANGVWINGRRIRQARLADGDIVTLGILRFRYTSQALALAASARVRP